MMNNYNVTPEFKTRVTELLSTQKFSTVFPYMNLINRDGFVYGEQELNSIVQYLGELPYALVAEFFTLLPSTVSNANEAPAPAAPAKESIMELVEDDVKN